MRKARQVASAKAEGTFATARCLSASLGYSSIKPNQLPDRIAVVLWLPQAPSNDERTKLLRAAHRLLMPTGGAGGGDCESVAPPGSVFIVDCTPLTPVGGSARDIMDKEVAEAGADARMGKTFSRPVSRLLERLLAGYKGGVTLVGVAAGAPLALCLLEQHSIKSIERVILIKPHISPSTVNALLVTPAP